MGRDQPRHVLGRVFAVGVHQDDGPALAMRVDVGQADRERALMANVATEMEQGHGRDPPVPRSPEEVGSRRIRGPVVDEDHLRAETRA
jgi:hypothetical protein